MILERRLNSRFYLNVRENQKRLDDGVMVADSSSIKQKRNGKRLDRIVRTEKKERK